MKLLPNFLPVTVLSAIAALFILVGCGDKAENPPQKTADTKKADPLEFLREVRPEYSKDKLLLTQALAGDKSAALGATLQYLFGRLGRMSKSEQAIAYLTTAAETGDWEAMEYLERVYAHTRFKNSERREHWRKIYREAISDAANRGNAEAMSLLGEAYKSGDIFPKDEKQSCEWYRKAADAGDMGGAYSSGQCYRLGLGVKQNLDEAIRLITLAADKGDGSATAVLLDIFRHQRPDKKLEETYFGRLMSPTSPNNGHSTAARSYCDNFDRMTTRRAARCELPALRNEPWCRKCTEDDKQKAIRLYEKAAALGEDDAARKLGEIYENGETVYGLSAEKARQWYEKSAELGDVIAQVKVGSSYLYGLGATPKNAEKAAIWLTKAAMQNWGEAQAILGSMYARGIGVTADPVLGYAWLNLAVANLTGSFESKERQEAESFRNALEKRMTPEQISEAQRLASSWERGQPLISVGATNVPASKPGMLTKKNTGTLFVVSTHGHAITNQHVVQQCKELRIEGRDGLAKKLTEDLVNDLALIQIPGDTTSAAMISVDPAKLRQGEDIIVFGFPLNSVLSSGGNLTPGVVSALTGLGNNTNQIQITAPIQPGSSGSPVLNKKGEVVGVVSMKLSDAKMASTTGQVGQNVNFAVSGQTLKSFLDAHKVMYRSIGLFSFEKNTADLAEEARKWTVVLECWK